MNRDRQKAKQHPRLVLNNIVSHSLFFFLSVSLYQTSLSVRNLSGFAKDNRPVPTLSLCLYLSVDGREGGGLKGVSPCRTPEVGSRDGRVEVERS